MFKELVSQIRQGIKERQKDRDHERVINTVWEVLDDSRLSPREKTVEIRRELAAFCEEGVINPKELRKIIRSARTEEARRDIFRRD